MKKKMRKILAGIIAGCMVLGMGITSMAASFPDVTGGWYYDAVQWISDSGYMKGYDNGNFGPHDLLNRGQFVTVLYRMDGSPDVPFEWGAFPDVEGGKFYSVPAIWGRDTGIMKGYNNGYFGYGDLITREQLVTTLYRYASALELDVSEQGNIYDYPDGGRVAKFSKDAVAWSLAAGIISGDQGNINPQGNANRAVCATILYRFMNWVEAATQQQPEQNPEQQPEQNPEQQPEQHVHNYVEQPIYETQQHYFCSGCQQDLTVLYESVEKPFSYEDLMGGKYEGFTAFLYYHEDNCDVHIDNKGGWYTKDVDVQIGTKLVCSCGAEKEQ